MIQPNTPEQLASTLRDLAAHRKSIRLGGAFTKDRLGRPVRDADETVSTACLRRVLKYEPRDLTISVEAGLRWSELEQTLAEHGQMLPLDPFTGPGWDAATVGGVIGANVSGPRRRLYGTARDMVIGMAFATLEGKLIQTGGMVVKNVAGLDMGKLMIGSFGTLAAVAVINFKVFPIPQASRTFVMEFNTARESFAARDRILRDILPPAAIDIVNWDTSGARNVYRLLLRATGNTAVIGRFTRELAGTRWLEGEDEAALWREIREFTPRFLAENPQGGVSVTGSPLSEMAAIAENLSVPFIARAGSGVIYQHHAIKQPNPYIHDEAGLMKKIKQMFDPGYLLNRERLYGYI